MIVNKIIALGLIVLSLNMISCKEKVNNSKASKKETSFKVHKTSNELSPKIHHYICYTNDLKKSNIIWVSFNKNNYALQIRYKGQKESINLKFDKEEYIKGGTHPTIIRYYNEIYQGKINGKYKLSHSGNWDYVTYTRGKDGKVFNFTIDHNSNPYSSRSCF